MMNLEVVILAAGQGKRMHSDKPKVLHSLASKPMLHHVLETASTLKPKKIHVIHGHGGEIVRKACERFAINWVEQYEQKGTGHAVIQALPFIDKSSMVLVLYGDVPLITQGTLTKLIAEHECQSLRLLTSKIENPFGLGRIIRDENEKVLGIVEERDATEKQREINEIYTGIMACPAQLLQDWLPNLNADNAQNEYYLTDLVAMATKDNVKIETVFPESVIEIQGVNDRLQLESLERSYQVMKCEQLLKEGTQILDKHRVDIRGSLSCGRGVTIDVNTVFIGNNTLEDNVSVGPNSIIKNSYLKQGAVIEANSIVEGSTVGENTVVGPFARLRPETTLAAHCKVGNFVEMKKTTMAEGSKANHLSYVGDALVGKKVNIGAGTITCNYDGANKHQTVIKDGAFIGSGTQLVAPVEIGENATIGAGTTLRDSAPDNQLTLSYKKTKTLASWQRPTKKKEKLG